MNLTVTYKIVNEFDAPRNEGHVLVFRQVNEGEWDMVRPSPRRSGYQSEKDAKMAIDNNVRADKAAATRLGLTIKFVTSG